MQNGAASKLFSEPSRGPHEYVANPSPSLILIQAGMASPNGKLSIVADGKTVEFSVNRRQIMGLGEQVFCALRNWEPGNG